MGEPYTHTQHTHTWLYALTITFIAACVLVANYVCVLCVRVRLQAFRGISVCCMLPIGCAKLQLHACCLRYSWNSIYTALLHATLMSLCVCVCVSRICCCCRHFPSLFVYNLHLSALVLFTCVYQQFSLELSQALLISIDCKAAAVTDAHTYINMCTIICMDINLGNIC